MDAVMQVCRINEGGFIWRVVADGVTLERSGRFDSLAEAYRVARLRNSSLHLELDEGPDMDDADA